MLSEIWIQVPITTMCVSLNAAQEPGTTRNHFFHPTFAAPGVQPYVLQIASSSACSFSKAYSVSVSIRHEEEAEQNARACPRAP